MTAIVSEVRSPAEAGGHGFVWSGWPMIITNPQSWLPQCWDHRHAAVMALGLWSFKLSTLHSYISPQSEWQHFYEQIPPSEAWGTELSNTRLTRTVFLSPAATSQQAGSEPAARTEPRWPEFLEWSTIERDKNPKLPLGWEMYAVDLDSLTLGALETEARLCHQSSLPYQSKNL